VQEDWGCTATDPSHTEGTCQVRNIRRRSRPVELCCDDPNLTPAAGLVTVAELDRVLGLVDLIDDQVGSLYRRSARYRPCSAGEVMIGLVESELAGGDFLCDIDHRRADTAGAELRAVAHPPASTTVGFLARGFGHKQLAGLEAADAVLVARAFEILPEPERARLLAVRPTIDSEPTDVEVYGKKKGSPAVSVGRSARLLPGSRDRPEAARRSAAGRLTSSIMAGAGLGTGLVKGRTATRVRPRLRRPLTTPRRGGPDRNNPNNPAPSRRTSWSGHPRERQKTQKKRGVAFNYAGQRCGRPHPGVWAEAGWVLAADLGSGTNDPRPQAPSLIARSVAALPDGLRRPIVRGDSGFFDSGVTRAALAAGADFAVAAKRNPAVWRAVRAVPADAWEPAHNMAGAEVAVCDYHPDGWPEGTRAILRRVRVDAEEIRADPRSRRRRTIDPDELKAVKQRRADHAYAYVIILTCLDWEPVEIDAWFRERAQVEERLKDSKLGMALRHLPSGYPAVNAVVEPPWV
jgi:hypothetical protein